MSRKLNPQLLVIILMSVGLLSACTPEIAAPLETSTAAPLEMPTVVPLDISEKLTVWCWQAAWEDSIVKSGALDIFKAAYPKVEIEYIETTPQEMYQELPLTLTAGTGAPDIACVESSHLAQLVDTGGLADLTDHVQPYLDKVNAFKWTDVEKDGKYYAMPWDSGPVVMFYRRDVFEAANLPSDPKEVTDMITSWDFFRKVCKTIKQETGFDCLSSNKANNSGRLYEMLLWQQGLGYYNSKGEITVDSPENMATLEVMDGFWYEGIFSDQLENTDGWYAELASMDKPVATLIEAAWMGELLKNSIAPGTEGLWGVAQMPPVMEGQARAANVGGSHIVIPEQSQNKDAAWVLVEWLFGREDTQVAIYRANNLFPSLESTYEDPFFSEPDNFFAGQVVRQTYVEQARIIPVGYIYGPYYSLMNEYVAIAIQKVATEQMTMRDALKQAADAIRDQTGMP